MVKIMVSSNRETQEKSKNENYSNVAVYNYWLLYEIISTGFWIGTKKPLTF
jgi:hypothetical protein